MLLFSGVKELRHPISLVVKFSRTNHSLDLTASYVEAPGCNQASSSESKNVDWRQLLLDIDS